MKCSQMSVMSVFVEKRNFSNEKNLKGRRNNKRIRNLTSLSLKKIGDFEVSGLQNLKEKINQNEETGKFL